MRFLFGWMRSHPVLAGGLGIVAFFCSCIGMANWIAEHRWQRYAADARARGVKLYLEDFAPPPIPDAENFACLPMIRAAFVSGKRPFELPMRNAALPKMGERLKGQNIDWIEWQKLFQTDGWLPEATEDPIRDVLAGLDHFAPQMAEWREWKVRTRCRFPLDLKAGAAMQMQHLSALQGAAHFFSLRARAHLAREESPEAYADFRDGIQAYYALTEEPTLISALVQMASLAIVINAVGEGLAAEAWDDAELKQMDADLAQVRIWEDYRRAFASERGFGNSIVEQVMNAPRSQRNAIFGGVPATPGGSTISSGIFALLPAAVFRNNELRMNQYHDELIERAGPRAVELDPDDVTKFNPENLAGIDACYFFLARLAAPIFSTLPKRFIFAQTRVDQARAAIALERFRLARGAFPEMLAELVPEFLAEVPRDLHMDAPMRYVRRDGGTFLLYALGSDRIDQGGKLDPTKGDTRQNDIVWLYAPAGH
jgi:hypothetical protein